MKILITGAAGFIGGYLVEALAKDGHHCRCLVRQTSNISKLKTLDNIEFVYGDVTEPDSLRGMAKEIDIVYHLAAAGHVSAISDESYQRFRKINIEGTENLAKECVKEPIQKFVHFSSTAAMGLIKKPVVDEKTPCQPATPYQRSKFESEQVVLSYWEKHNLPTVILRPCMVYGPEGKGEFLKICRLIKKGFFPKVGRGKNLTPMVQVENVVQAAILAGKKGTPGGIYLVTSDKSFELDYIRNLVVHCLKVKRPYLYVPTAIAKLGARLAEVIARITKSVPVVTYKNIDSTVTDRVFSIEKAKKELGYMPKVSLEKQVEQTIQWYKGNGYL